MSKLSHTAPSEAAVVTDVNLPSAFVRVHDATSSWLCQEEFVEQLLPQGKLPIDRWTAEGRVSAVKSGPHRSVLRIVTPVGVLFVKKYAVTDWTGRLLHLVRPPAAVREWNAIDAVRQAGIPTVEALAVGTVRAGLWTGESWLLTREIPDVTPLDEFVKDRRSPGGFSRSKRALLACQLGRLIGRMHAAGFVHRDLHAGNILVRSSGEAISVWLIDLHEIRPVRFLSVESAGRNLALFDHFFLGLATPSDRRRFFAAWWDEVGTLRNSPSAPRSESAACRQIDAHCRAAEASAFAKRDRKWRRGNRRLIVADSNGVACRGLAPFGKERLKAWRDAAEDASPMSGNDSDGAEIVVRSFPPVPSLLARLRARWTGMGAARTAWEMGHALLRRRIQAVLPVACVDRTATGEHSRLLLDVRSRSTLEDILRMRDWPSLRPNLSRRLIEQSARLIRRLHDAGFVHESLSIQGLRVSGSDDLTVSFDDLHAVRKMACVSHPDRVAQLALLARSMESSASMKATDRMRFVRAYLSAAPAGWGKPSFVRRERAMCRALWRDVAGQIGAARNGITRSVDAGTIKPVDRLRHRAA